MADQDYKGVEGLQYPENGARLFQEDFESEQSGIGQEVTDREADFFSPGVIEGFAVTASATPGCVDVAAGKARDPEGRRIVKTATAAFSVPDGQTVKIIVRHVWADDPYIPEGDSVQKLMRRHSSEIAYIANSATPSDRELELARVTRSGGTVTVDNDLRIWAGTASQIFVALRGNQAIAGLKTFSNIPILPNSNPTTENQAVRKKYADKYSRGRSRFVPLLASTMGLNLNLARSNIVTVDTGPQEIAFDGTHIWVTSSSLDILSKINIATNLVVATVNLDMGSSPRGIAFDGTYIWVANNGSSNVSKINITTNAVVATVAVGTMPEGITFDGTHIWVANNNSTLVSKINIDTNTVITTVDTISEPYGIAFDGVYIWVTRNGSTLSKIDVNTNLVIATVAVGASAQGIAFDGTHMWIANRGDNNVQKIVV